MEIGINKITVDPSIQVGGRGLDQETVQRYAMALTNGADFPPVVVFDDGCKVWLSAGFHRMAAYRFLNHEIIEVDVRRGTRQDAMVFAATDNVKSGKPMSRAETKNAGIRLLKMTDWSQERVANELAVGRASVSRWASTLPNERVSIVGQDGRAYNTSNIGKEKEGGEMAQPTLMELGEGAKEAGITRCAVCGELYDESVFFNRCPYCWKKSRGLQGWVEELPEKMGVKQKPHVSQSTGNNEWYTPPKFIEAARQVMGGIDCDPASSEIANRTVKAETFYTAEDNGLLQTWGGRVWMNPPYSQPLVRQFCETMINKLQLGEIQEACVLVNNATETGWFHTLLSEADCLCLLKGRVKFLDTEGNPSGAPLQGQAVLYYGDNVGEFVHWFGDFGMVMYVAG